MKGKCFKFTEDLKAVALALHFHFYGERMIWIYCKLLVCSVTDALFPGVRILTSALPWLSGAYHLAHCCWKGSIGFQEYLCCILEDPSSELPKVFVPIYISSRSVWKLVLLHIHANLWHCFYFYFCYFGGSVLVWNCIWKFSFVGWLIMWGSFHEHFVKKKKKVLFSWNFCLFSLN